MTLNGKVALVTGASRGIGAAIAERLAHDRADVAVTYQRNAESAANVVERINQVGTRGLAIRATAADPAEVTGAIDRTVAELGGIDILVNNAGIFPFGPFESFTIRCTR